MEVHKTYQILYCQVASFVQIYIFRTETTDLQFSLGASSSEVLLPESFALYEIIGEIVQKVVTLSCWRREGVRLVVGEGELFNKLLFANVESFSG